MNKGSKTEYINEHLEDRCEYWVNCATHEDDLCYGNYEGCWYFHHYKSLQEQLKSWTDKLYPPIDKD